MFDILREFPLIIAHFKVHQKLGEMRLQFDPKSISGSCAKCRLLLARVFKKSGWFPGQRVELFPEGIVTIVDRGEGVFEIVDGLLPVLLRTLGEVIEGIGLGISPKLRFDPSPEAEGVWRLNGRVEVEGGGWVEQFLAKLISPKVEGEALLFKKDLTQDASGKFRGRYYLQLVPISLNESGDGALPVSFDDQRRQAERLWAQGSVEVLINPDRAGLTLTRAIDNDLRSGVIKRKLAAAVKKKFPDGASGVPVILVDRVFKESGGDTTPGSPLTSFIVITNKTERNHQLLAHEVGHILGGEHDGDSPGSPRWAEISAGANSVMTSTNSILIEHPFKLGSIAAERAANWAFFEKLPL